VFHPAIFLVSLTTCNFCIYTTNKFFAVYIIINIFVLYSCIRNELVLYYLLLKVGSRDGLLFTCALTRLLHSLGAKTAMPKSLSDLWPPVPRLQRTSPTSVSLQSMSGRLVFFLKMEIAFHYATGAKSLANRV
jgi:hypothetical protein